MQKRRRATAPTVALLAELGERSACCARRLGKGSFPTDKTRPPVPCIRLPGVLSKEEAGLLPLPTLPWTDLAEVAILIVQIILVIARNVV